MDQLTRKANGTIEIKISLAWADIQKEVDHQTEIALSQAELPGFRKGKAPRELVEPKLDKSALLSKALGELLPTQYSQIVATQKLKPILYPHIHLDKGETGQDFEFTATTCEAPTVSLPVDYAKKIRQIDLPSEKEKHLSVIINWLTREVSVQIPDLLVEEEANHRLTALAENLTPLGITMTKYLETKKITPETLKSQTIQSARVDLEIEFILGQIQTDQKLPDRSQTLKFLTGVI